MTQVKQHDRFGIAMHAFIGSRLECTQPSQYSREHALKTKEFIQLYNKLMDMLPEEGKKALLELDSLSGFLRSEEQELAFRCGFSDGIRLIVQASSGDGI